MSLYCDFITKIIYFILTAVPNSWTAFPRSSLSCSKIHLKTVQYELFSITIQKTEFLIKYLICRVKFNGGHDSCRDLCYPCVNKAQVCNTYVINSSLINFCSIWQNSFSGYALPNWRLSKFNYPLGTNELPC